MKAHMTRAGWREGGAADRSESDRRLALLRRAGLYSNDTRGAEITRATSPEDLAKAYRLVHDVYVRQGYIHGDPTGMRVRPFEALPDTATFVAKAADEVVGVTTVVTDSQDFGLPLEKAFKAEVNAIRGQGRKLCEATNWLVAESHRGSAVMSELMRCSFAHALATQCTDYVGAVSPGHGKFFQLLGFEQPGDARSYSNDIDDPVVLIRLDIVAFRRQMANVVAGRHDVQSFIKDYYVESNPYHRLVGMWQAESDRLFANPSLLSALFVDESQFLASCGPEVLYLIEQRWGEQMLGQVLLQRPELTVPV